MKRLLTIISSFFLFTGTTAIAQTVQKEYKVGHVFTVSLPGYMNKTTGLNSSSAIQFKSSIKDVYGFIIEDGKEELRLAEINFTSVNDFYENFIQDFLKDQEKREVSKPKTQSIGSTNFIESEVTYYDKDAKGDLYYFIGIAETKTYYYKVLCWVVVENKDKFKADFQKILYSLKD